jgi:hypothetical protein
MLPADTIAEITTNLASLHLESNITAQILAAVLAPLLRVEPNRPSIFSPRRVVLLASRFAERTLRNIRSRSFRLDVRRPDHLAPLLGIVCDKFAEVGRRACKHRPAQVGKPRL